MLLSRPLARFGERGREKKWDRREDRKGRKRRGKGREGKGGGLHSSLPTKNPGSAPGNQSQMTLHGVNHSYRALSFIVR